MINIHKEYIVDDSGKPTKVILPLADFRLIEEILGLDLDEEAIADLEKAKNDRQKGRNDAFIDLEDL